MKKMMIELYYKRKLLVEYLKKNLNSFANIVALNLIMKTFTSVADCLTHE